MVGQNIRIPIPEPRRGDHDGDLDHYRQGHERQITGTNWVVAGRRRDGSIFPMELAVGKLRSGDRCSSPAS